MYDYYLGGKDHFPADRAAAERILGIAPETARLARDNRAFVGRAVRFLVGAGIRQFLDLGTGLPTGGNVHEVAHGLAPDVRSVHVDEDEVVCAHARALLSGTTASAVVAADLRRPDDVLTDPEVGRLIDFDRPVAVFLASVLHFVPDDHEAEEIMARYRAVMVPGSHLVISHGSPGTISDRVRTAGQDVYARSSSPARLREPAEVARLFGDLTLIEPGLVDVAGWRPDQPPATGEPGAFMVGGVARRG